MSIYTLCIGHRRETGIIIRNSIPIGTLLIPGIYLYISSGGIFRRCAD